MFNNNIKPHLIWEAYSRYYLAAASIYNASKYLGIEEPTVLEIGSNGTGELNEFLPKAQVTHLNLYPSNIAKNNDKFIIADASNMYMISENSYDFVISCAVLEHIPIELHKSVLSESYRVAKFGVFHGAPQESEYVCRAERTVSNYHEVLFGCKHRWIEEHLINGHPDIDLIRNYCKELGFDFYIFEHMDCDLWTALYNTTLDLTAYGSDFKDYLNSFYQKELFLRDVGDNNIFIYLYISKKGMAAKDVLKEYTDKLNKKHKQEVFNDFSDFAKHLTFTINQQSQIKLKNELCKLKELNSKGFNYVKIIEKLENDRQSLTGKVSKLNKEIEHLKNDNLSLTNELLDIHNASFWKITKPLRKIIDSIRNIN